MIQTWILMSALNIEVNFVTQNPRINPHSTPHFRRKKGYRIIPLNSHWAVIPTMLGDDFCHEDSRDLTKLRVPSPEVIDFPFLRIYRNQEPSLLSPFAELTDIQSARANVTTVRKPAARNTALPFGETIWRRTKTVAFLCGGLKVPKHPLGLPSTT